ncbi:hypothetical protein ACFS07_10185 [Undibacterium arcticum]
MVEEFGIPYVVSLGSLAEGRTVYVSDQGDTNAAVLSAVSDKVIEEVIEDLKQRGEVNKASAKQLLANPDTSGFKLKSQAQDLDMQLLQDIIKMPRDLRVSYGENVRVCMGRIMLGIFSYGTEDNKPALLRLISADVDLLKHYLSQAPRLSNLKFAFEHRVGLAVELGEAPGRLNPLRWSTAMINEGGFLESLAMRSSGAATGTRTTMPARSISTTTGPTTTTTTSASADPKKLNA